MLDENCRGRASEPGASHRECSQEETGAGEGHRTLGLLITNCPDRWKQGFTAFDLPL